MSPVKIGLALCLVVNGIASGQRSVVLPSASQYVVRDNQWLFETSCNPPNGWPNSMQNIFPIEPAAVGTVTSIAFRRGYGAGLPQSFPAIVTELEMGMCHTPHSATIPAFTQSGNRGMDWRIVVDRQSIQFPAVPYQPSLPYPFTYRIPLDRPFTLIGNRFALWEITVHASSVCYQKPLHMDGAMWPRDVSQSPVVSFGSPCGQYGATSNDNRIQVSPLNVGNYGDAGMNPQFPTGGRSFAVFFAGSQASHWYGLPLPYNLGAHGAPGCFVHIGMEYLWPMDLQLFHGQVTLAAIDIPAAQVLQGAHLFLQGVRFDANNVLDVATSNGLRATIGPHSPTWGAITCRWYRNNDWVQRMPRSAIFELTYQ